MVLRTGASTSSSDSDGEWATRSSRASGGTTFFQSCPSASYLGSSLISLYRSSVFYQQSVAQRIHHKISAMAPPLHEAVSAGFGRHIGLLRRCRLRAEHRHVIGTCHSQGPQVRTRGRSHSGARGRPVGAHSHTNRDTNTSRSKPSRPAGFGAQCKSISGAGKSAPIFWDDPRFGDPRAWFENDPMRKSPHLQSVLDDLRSRVNRHV